MPARTKWPRHDKKNDTYEVQPPDPTSEDLYLYYEYVPERFEEFFAHTPKRVTLAKYLSKAAMPGYPVKRGGPYIKMPALIQAKRPYTSKSAMDRFFKLVDKLEKANGIDSIRG